MIWRGEIYDVDLGSPVGHEPAFLRPALVVSADLINNGPGDLIVVVPISTTRYGLRSHVAIETGASGLGYPSYGRCDQIRSISTDRLVGLRGVAGVAEVDAIDRALKFILDI